MKYTIRSPYKFLERGIKEHEDLPCAGRLPYFWYTLSRAFRRLALQTPSLHTNIVVIACDDRVENSFDVERALTLSGDHAGITLVVAEEDGGPTECYIHDDRDGDDEAWSVECSECVPWTSNPIDSLQCYLTVGWVLQHCRRQLVSLTCTTSSSIPRQLYDSRPQDFPMLTELNFCKTRTAHDYHTREAVYSAGIWGAKGLRRIRYEGARLPGHGGFATSKSINWDRLLYLHASERVSTTPYTPDLTLPATAHHLLHKARNLLEFHVTIWDDDFEVQGDEDLEHYETPSTGLLHPTLRRMSVAYSRTTTYQNGRTFFAKLRLPKLREFSIRGQTYSYPSADLLPFLHRHSDLTALTISGLSVRRDDLVDALRSLNVLKTLEVGVREDVWWDDSEDVWCGDRRPLSRPGAHLCDENHLCDLFLEHLSAPLWDGAQARVASGRSRTHLSRGMEAAINLVGYAWHEGPTSTVEVTICPVLENLSVIGAKFTPVGLKAFLQARAPRIQSLVLKDWDQVDGYELWQLREELAREGVHLVGTTMYETELRDFTGAMTLRRKRMWAEVSYMARRVRWASLSVARNLLRAVVGVAGLRREGEEDNDGWGVAGNALDEGWGCVDDSRDDANPPNVSDSCT